MEKICKTCKELLPIESFYNNKQSKDGKVGDCKDCRKQKYKLEKKYYPKQKLSQIDLKSNFLQLKGISKEDYVIMWELIKSIRYDITKDIHQQFIDRHNLLTYKKRNPKAITKYLYDGSINTDYTRT